MQKVAVSTSDILSYNTKLNANGAGAYARLNLTANVPYGEAALDGNLTLNDADDYIDMYVFQAFRDPAYASTNPLYSQLVPGQGHEYQMQVRLFGNGDVMVNPADPAPVPVPGALWLLGSGVAGMLGMRRRENA